MKCRPTAVAGLVRLGHNLTKRGRVVAVAVGLVALIASAGPVAAHVGDAGQPNASGSDCHRLAMTCAPAAAHAPSSCTTAERRRALAVEQRRVLRLVKDFRVLRSQADLARLTAPNEGAVFWVYSHMFASVRGMGFTVVNGGQAGPGKPALLFYRPSPKARNVVDPFGLDFPYTLVGWGYAGTYVPGQAPSYPDDPGLRCLVANDWFVHERSVHPADTWQNIPVPPDEQFHGQAPGTEPPLPTECDPLCFGAAHGRLWDIHLWIGSTGVPVVSMLNPGRPVPGFDPKVGTGFFYLEPGGSQLARGSTRPRGTEENTPPHHHGAGAPSQARITSGDPASSRSAPV